MVVPDWMYRPIVDASGEIGVFGHGFTYSGHPVCAAVANRVLQIYEREHLFEHAASVGERFQERLRAFRDHPLVGETRGVGLIGAVELVADPEAKRAFPASAGIGAFCAKRCEAHGVIVRPLADSIAFCPPLIITEADIDEVFDRFGRALDDTAEHAREQGLI